MSGSGIMARAHTISRFKLQMLCRCVRRYHDGRAGTMRSKGIHGKSIFHPRASVPQTKKLQNSGLPDRKSVEARPVTEIFGFRSNDR